ncbi:MAG: GDP-mannose 4,6-dehydratase, partial [Actinomycetia bacterium]|nr:GDP-mannose 4,6-dehydratase [Actinomycetes bacterium]
AGVSEKGIDKKTGNVIVEIDPKYFRPTEVEALRGDSSKARAKLGWKPKVTFTELVKIMTASDLESAKQELPIPVDESVTVES